MGHIFLLLHMPIIFKSYAGHFGSYVEKTQHLTVFLLIMGHIFLLLHMPIIFKSYAGPFGSYVEKTQHLTVFLSRMCFVLTGS